MEVKNITPPVNSFLEVKLDKEIIDYLWKIIEIAKSTNLDHKRNLVGNISNSFLLNDIDGYFYKNVCIPLVEYYRKKNVYGGDPVDKNTILDSIPKLILESIWVNYQYQTEFNPYHHHSGVYSFAIWLKIPYYWKDQKNLPQFKEIEEHNKKAGNFEFEYINSLGDIRNMAYKLSKDLEGTMLLFPAKLRHCVYPFYNTKDPRISIAGNLYYSPNGVN